MCDHFAASSNPIVRTVSFRLGMGDVSKWNGSDTATLPLNALSVFLPAGEQFFVRTIREVQAAGDSALREPAAQLDAFVMQETAHRKQHALYNARLSEHYPSVRHLLGYMDLSWRIKRRLMPLSSRLAVTVAVEHFTTLIARAILGSADYLADGDPEFAALWRWHALEELEHKAVAHALYNRMGYSRLRLRATMAIVTLAFAAEYLSVLAGLLKDDKKLASSTFWRGMFELWRGDAAGRFRKGYWRFYARAFEPAETDDSGLLQHWGSDAGLRAHILRERRA